MSIQGSFIRGPLLWILSALLLTGMTYQASKAQYFGRNKVQYEDFDFKVLDTDNFNIYYYPPESTVVYDAARMAERWYRRMAPLFDHQLEADQPIIFYASHADFQQTNVISGLIGQSTGGVTEALLNRVTLPLTGVNSENNHVIGHELVHAFHYSIMKDAGGGLAAARGLPLWFIEGMSEYLSLGIAYPPTDMWIRDAVIREVVPTLDDLSSDPDYFPYRWGHAFWIYVASIYGDRVIPALFKAGLQSGLETAIEDILNITADSLSGNWQESIRSTYTPRLANRTLPDEIGTRIISGGQKLNLSPSLSPEGKYIAFFSRRDIFTLDLYLADAETGDILRKLASSRTDAHFDALRFTSSSGAWSPDGRQFAFVVVRDGDDAIAIADVSSGDIDRVLAVDGVEAVSHVDWSPDGASLVLSGTSGAIGDLYRYDLSDSSVQNLTRDRYADIQPQWSPDGTTIVFSTDRGPITDFSELTFGPMQIGMLNVATGRIKTLSLSPDAKHINPQFSPDGAYIYFISDEDGFSDVYRYHISDDEYERLTTIATGISGLTELSPALSVAEQSGDLAVNVFVDAGYTINRLPPPEQPQTVATSSVFSAPSPDNSPEFDSNYLPVSEYLHAPEFGLTDGSDFTINDYSPSLSLAYAGRTLIGISADRYGTSLGGGVNLLYSDILGNHLLGISGRLSGSFKDAAAEVFYQNRDHRINWGGLVGHIPSRFVEYSRSLDTTVINGDSVVVLDEQLIQKRAYTERAALLAEYPLSTNRRFEVTTGISWINYEYEAQHIQSRGGFIVDRFEEDLPSPEGLILFNSSLGYVGDYSFYGFTSPLSGRRYRIEAEPTFGSLRYLTMIADYRHYFFLKPITFAFRGLHVGRYLKDSESERLSPFYLGAETLVRGYSAGSFALEECTRITSSGRCLEVDRLLGSRIAVFNAELRLPLFGNEQLGLINFRYLPIEISAFFDGGVAWSKGDDVVFKIAEKSRQRIPVFSAGLTARINLFGYIIGQVYWAFPFQRPEKTSQFGFLISPGW